MKLARDRRGPSDVARSTLAFVHGFTQTSRSWNPVIDALCRDHPCISLDAPGHGDSPVGTRSLTECGDDIAETTPQCTLVGYSMGARMALHAVLDHPDHFDGIVLVSGTPGIENDAERRARRASDDMLADRIESIGVARFIDEWLANPMFADLTPTMAMKDDRLRNTASGLADSLRHAGTGTQTPLWNRLPEIRCPVLVVTGERDAKFTEIGTRMARLVPRATLVTIAGAGHTVHLEDTPAFIACLRDWLQDQASAIANPTA